MTFSPGRQTVLFEEEYQPRVFWNEYDVHPDGERFVMIKQGEPSVRLIVVLNWFEELRRVGAALHN